MSGKIVKNYRPSLKANAAIIVLFTLTLILTSVVAVAAKNTHSNNAGSRRPITPPGLLKKDVLPPGIVLHRPATPSGLLKK